MANDDVFIDTSALTAIINEADALHPAAVELHHQFRATQTRLITSDWVLAEFLCVVARPLFRARASGIIRLLKASPRVTIIKASRGNWDRAFDFFERYSDKAWSFVDCSSMLICEDRGIRRVFTYEAIFGSSAWKSYFDDSRRKRDLEPKVVTDA